MKIKVYRRIWKNICISIVHPVTEELTLSCGRKCPKSKSIKIKSVARPSNLLLVVIYRPMPTIALIPTTDSVRPFPTIIYLFGDSFGATINKTRHLYTSLTQHTVYQDLTRFGT